jgi:hypothetical protein
MTETIWTHIGIAAGIVIPLGSGIGYLIWQQAQLTTKVDLLWHWFTNDAHEFTGYKPGDERKR